MADTISIRPFETADVPEVLEVMRLALGETDVLQRSPELFAWKHLVNPFGESIALVATSGDQIVGLRAFMRWRLRSASGETLECVRPVDTATHPDFRRRGIFRRLTMEAIDLARERGIHLIFNTPNEQSRPGYLKMGWQDVGPIGVMVRPTSSMLGKRSADGRPSIAEQLPAATGVDGLSVIDRPARGLRTVRDDSYLRWRFGAHPTAEYGVVGDGGDVVVFRANHRRGRRELVVSDLFGSGGGARIRAAARDAAADYLVGWFSPGSPERKAALRGGLLPVPRVVALDLVAFPLVDLPIDVTQLATWDLAMGDLELL